MRTRIRSTAPGIWFPSTSNNLKNRYPKAINKRSLGVSTLLQCIQSRRINRKHLVPSDLIVINHKSVVNFPILVMVPEKSKVIPHPMKHQRLIPYYICACIFPPFRLSLLCLSRAQFNLYVRIQFSNIFHTLRTR